MHGKYCNIYYHPAQLKYRIHTVCTRELAQLSFAPLLIPPQLFLSQAVTHTDARTHQLIFVSSPQINPLINRSTYQSVSHPLRRRTLLRRSTLLTHWSEQDSVWWRTPTRFYCRSLGLSTHLSSHWNLTPLDEGLLVDPPPSLIPLTSHLPNSQCWQSSSHLWILWIGLF